MNLIRYHLMTAILLSATFFLLPACSTSETSAEQTGFIAGVVSEIEEYGHAALNITVQDFADAGFAPGDIVTVKFDHYEADMPYFSGYYANPGELMVRGRARDTTIAVCINYGIFSEEAGINPGDPVSIVIKEKAGALDAEEVNALEYISFDRADYESDAAFANFRPVTAGNISEGTLYRSSSPIDNDYQRAEYAETCAEAAGIVTVLNLANSAREIEDLFLVDDFDSPYYKVLYESGHVIPLNLGADFFSERFAESLAEGLARLAESDPPYLIHCQEGRDRTGFAVMILEALMGADLKEIEEDYMRSYDHYFGITEASNERKYQAILEINLTEMLYHVTGLEKGAALESVDLSAAAAKYLTDAGMEAQQIELLKTRLK